MKMCMGQLEFIKDYAKNKVGLISSSCAFIQKKKNILVFILHSKHLWKKEVAHVVDLAVNKGFFS